MPRLRLPAVLHTPLTLSRRATLYVWLLLLVLVFVPLIVASSRWSHAPRIDLTADQLYTLTPGTLQIVGTLQRPLRLTLYFSDHAARDLPQLRSYEQRVREMLQEMAARAHGHIRLRVIDPAPYSDDVWRSAADELKKRAIVKDGDFVICTKGEFSGITGGTNSLKILRVGD